MRLHQRMPRALRVEFPGAIYHIMSRGDRKEAIFWDDEDRRMFMDCLGQACGKTGWWIHAYVLMPNHYHLMVETPEANLVAGMKWFQGTYTIRINRRHQLSGHLFQGRYKSLVIDGDSRGYLSTVGHYIHLNPVRARIVNPSRLHAFPWSSLPYYVNKRGRPDWLHVERVLGDLGLPDTPIGRHRYRLALRRRARQECGGTNEEEASYASIRRGWLFGEDEFRHRITGMMVRPGASTSYSGPAAQAHGIAEAQRVIKHELEVLQITAAHLAQLAWTDQRKRRIARRLRSETTVSNAWIAQQLGGGHESTVSRAVHEQE